jgi:hypothetical protein
MKFGGFENKNIIEKNNFQFCIKILGVRTSTPKLGDSL